MDEKKLKPLQAELTKGVKTQLASIRFLTY